MPPPTSTLDVLFEDNHLLVVNKPAMLPTMGVASSRPSLLKLAKRVLRASSSTSRAMSIWELSAGLMRRFLAWCCWHARRKRRAG